MLRLGDRPSSQESKLEPEPDTVDGTILLLNKSPIVAIASYYYFFFVAESSRDFDSFSRRVLFSGFLKSLRIF